MRKARHDDLPYFIEAARQFVAYTPLRFNPESYAKTVTEMIDDESVICFVNGNPPAGHCAAKLIASFYDSSEIIAHVYTTWGIGGLRCFQEVVNAAKERGATLLMADSFIEARIIRFYERQDMKLTDSIYIKRL